MMSFRTTVSFLMLSLFYCPAAHGSSEIHTNMAGSVSCVSFLKARVERKTLPFELWLSGYLTGLATYDRKINNAPKLEVANGEAGTLLLESYCKLHPLESFQVAAREMARTVFYARGR
jgi:hypothetical protein